MKTRIIITLTFLALLGLNSCNEFFGCIRGNGRIAFEERIVGNFDEIESNGNFYVRVIRSSRTTLSVETDENLLPYIRTFINGNTLVIETRNDRCIRSAEPIYITVETPSIEELHLNGSGTIECNNVTTERMDLFMAGSGRIECRGLLLEYARARISGSGDIILGGETEVADYTITGSGQIRGLDLYAETVFADITGSGNIYTTANTVLDVTISGSGNVYYQGNPEISSDISGSGSIRRY